MQPSSTPESSDPGPTDSNLGPQTQHHVAESDVTTTAARSAIPKFHRQLLQYLKTQEAALWEWFSSNQIRNQNAETVRLDLLKNAYRLGPESSPEIYDCMTDVAARMSVQIPITVYQMQNSAQLNASLAWIPGEIHVVLHGPIQDTLQTSELSALFAHEVAHHELHSLQDGDFCLVEQIVTAMLADPSGSPVHDRTWRSLRLWTELFCDRRAAEVCDDIEPCVAMLVKVQTGLKDVNAKSYLQQAGEIIQNGMMPSEGITHPEMYLRAYALDTWVNSAETADHELKALVEGPLALESLDVLRQHHLQNQTRIFICAFLQEEWLQSDLILAHAHRFLTPNEPATTEQTKSRIQSTDRDMDQLRAELAQCDLTLRQYFCYLLLDFITCDADLEDAPLAAAFVFTEAVGLITDFRELARSELKVGRRVFEAAEKSAAQILQSMRKETQV